MLNKPNIPTGVTFEVLPTKFVDGTIAFDINELHDGKLGSSYATEIANCADAEEAQEWWEDNGLVELYYSTDNGTTWSNYNMVLYVSPTPGPTKIQLGTNGIWWKLYWWQDLNHEIASDILTGDTDLSNYYTKTQADGKFLATYRKIQLSNESLGAGDDVETHSVNQFWDAVEVYWGSGAEEYWSMTGYVFPEAYDSANDNYYVKIYNVHAGDVINFGNMLLKETTSSTPHILIINNSGTTLWSEEIPVNSQTNPSTLWTDYTFTADYDYIIIGTDCDKPAYVQNISYYVPLADNSDLGDVIPTISQVQTALGNKANTWDIVQSDWTQSDTGANDYIKNKPNLATVATSGSYNDLSNKPNLATVATSGSYNDLSNKPTVPKITPFVYTDVIPLIIDANEFRLGIFVFDDNANTAYSLTNYCVINNITVNTHAQNISNTSSNPVFDFTFNSKNAIRIYVYGDWVGNIYVSFNQFGQLLFNTSGATKKPTYLQIYIKLMGGSSSYWDFNVQQGSSYSDRYSNSCIILLDKLATVGTPVSKFTNDAGYLTQHQSLANCVQSTTANMKIEVVSEMPANPANNTLYVVQ